MPVMQFWDDSITTLSAKSTHILLSLLNTQSQHNLQNQMRIRFGLAQPQLDNKVFMGFRIDQFSTKKNIG